MSQIKEADKKSINSLHLALTAGPMFLVAIFYYLMLSKEDFNYSTNSIYFIIAAVLILLSILIGTKIYNTNINNAAKREFESYTVAAANFRAANLVKWFFLESSILFSIVLAFLDNNPFIFFPVIAGIFYLFVSKTKEEHFNFYKF